MYISRGLLDPGGGVGGFAVTLAAWCEYSLTGKCTVAQSVQEQLDLLELRCLESLYF